MAIEALLDELRSRGEHETYPPASDDDLRQTESALGVALPPSFRSFVTGFSNGAYLFMLQEVSAVGSGNEQIGAIQDNAVQFEEQVPFSLDSNGNAWCFVPSKAASDEVIRVLGFTDELGLG